MNKKNKASSVKTPKILKENKFSPLAIEVVEKLKQAGFQGYLVGGCVRDLLVGIKAKDFDVSTDATPEEVQKWHEDDFFMRGDFDVMKLFVVIPAVIQIVVFGMMLVMFYVNSIVF